LALTRAHLTWVGGAKPHAIVRLLPLKKQPGQQPVPLLVVPGDGSGADAYAALDRLERLDPVHPSLRATTPLVRLCTRRSGPSQPIHLTRTVRAAVVASGESPSTRHFSGRSLRVGGATELASMGVPEATVRMLGRWASDIHRAYTRVALGSAMRVSAAMGPAPELEGVALIFIRPTPQSNRVDV
jgi:hypothetical protein